MIGIVVLLMAILFPAIAKARQQALTVKCAANLHSIGQALIMYTQVYGYYPAHHVLKPGSGAWVGGYSVWPTRLRRVMGGDQGVFFCPSLDSRFEWPKGAAPGGVATQPATEGFTGFGYEKGEPLLDAENGFFSYGYNLWGADGNIPSKASENRGLGGYIHPGDREYREIRAGRVRAAAEMIAIADSTADGLYDSAIVPGPPAP